MSSPKPRLGRKLLVATVGLAAVSYVACSDNQTGSSGNLMPPPADTGVAEDSGGTDGIPADIGSGNLVPPPDTGADTSATDASDSASSDTPSG